jgi:anti-sigma factor RsiW
MSAPASLRFRRDHRFTAGHLSAYVDGDLAVRPRARIARHVPECPECAAALRSLERMLVLLHALGTADPDGRPDIAAAVRRRLREPAAG